MTALLSGPGLDRIRPVQIFKVTGLVSPFFGWTICFLIQSTATVPILKSFQNRLLENGMYRKIVNFVNPLIFIFIMY